MVTCWNADCDFTADISAFTECAECRKPHCHSCVTRRGKHTDLLCDVCFTEEEHKHWLRRGVDNRRRVRISDANQVRAQETETAE